MNVPKTIDLTRLFEAQRIFDAKVMELHPNAENTLEKRCVALLVEIGELMNEWRGFKFWSNDQEPRGEMVIDCPKCNGQKTYYYSTAEGMQDADCDDCDEHGEIVVNPLLEEYVDCLHLAVSIAIARENDEPEEPDFPNAWPVFHDLPLSESFVFLMVHVTKLYYDKWDSSVLIMIGYLLGIGFSLEFTWEQIETAYFAKNAVNHQRQETNY